MEAKIIYNELSGSALKILHASCVIAYMSDRDPESVMREVELWRKEHFGVDEFPDWNEHVKNIEKELSKRNIAFDSIELR